MTCTTENARLLAISYEAYVDALNRRAKGEPDASRSVSVWGRMLADAQDKTGVVFFTRASLIR